ncbi:MAG: YkgJ family cysteine cluster protein [Desulfuromonadaceae bacterium]|jgi:Fe-S-cluster containining protein|nr:YkgJ family cysteine cluster protein [Desulfuromonas sp.]MDY0184324.1 YkgJ family cysteine cluster protein [Desulfuromonadaceae bacterium]
MQILTSTTTEFDFYVWSQSLIAEFGAQVMSVQPEQLRLEDFLGRVEKVLSRGLSGEDQRHIACGAGCGACCCVNVATLQPEAHNIVAHLRSTCSAAELGEWSSRMEQMLAMICGLDDEERIASSQPCVFLDQQGRCSIYPVRPLLCRSVTSTCASACRAALQLSMFEEPQPIMMNMFQKELMETAFTALALMWCEGGGDGRSQELTAAVYPLLHL